MKSTWGRDDINYVSQLSLMKHRTGQSMVNSQQNWMHSRGEQHVSMNSRDSVRPYWVSGLGDSYPCSDFAPASSAAQNNQKALPLQHDRVIKEYYGFGQSDQDSFKAVAEIITKRSTAKFGAYPTLNGRPTSAQ